MASQLFAFNVSKKTESIENDDLDQWKGDGTAYAANCFPCLCTSSNYGFPTCLVQSGICYVGGRNGYYHCDPV